MGKGRILPPWVLFGERIDGPPLEEVIKKFDGDEVQLCEEYPVNIIYEEKESLHEESGGTKGRTTSKKINVKSSIIREVEELCRIARSINQEKPYPAGVWKIDEFSGFPEVDLYDHIEKERYKEARTFLDKYKREFTHSNFLKKSDQEQLMKVLERIVVGEYDEKIIEQFSDEEFIAKNLEPRFKVYVVPGSKQAPDFEEAMFKISGYNEKYGRDIDIFIIPYILEKGGGKKKKERGYR